MTFNAGDRIQFNGFAHGKIKVRRRDVTADRERRPETLPWRVASFLWQQRHRLRLWQSFKKSGFFTPIATIAAMGIMLVIVFLSDTS
jgi:hypothetical protein